MPSMPGMFTSVITPHEPVLRCHWPPAVPRSLPCGTNSKAARARPLSRQRTAALAHSENGRAPSAPCMIYRQSAQLFHDHGCFGPPHNETHPARHCSVDLAPWLSLWQRLQRQRRTAVLNFPIVQSDVRAPLGAGQDFHSQFEELLSPDQAPQIDYALPRTIRTFASSCSDRRVHREQPRPRKWKRSLAPANPKPDARIDAACDRSVVSQRYPNGDCAGNAAGRTVREVILSVLLALLGYRNTAGFRSPSLSARVPAVAGPRLARHGRINEGRPPTAINRF